MLVAGSSADLLVPTAERDCMSVSVCLATTPHCSSVSPPRLLVLLAQPLVSRNLSRHGSEGRTTAETIMVHTVTLQFIYENSLSIYICFQQRNTFS